MENIKNQRNKHDFCVNLGLFGQMEHGTSGATLFGVCKVFRQMELAPARRGVELVCINAQKVLHPLVLSKF
jgi:hypothetical protein